MDRSQPALIKPANLSLLRFGLLLPVALVGAACQAEPSRALPDQQAAPPSGVTAPTPEPLAASSDPGAPPAGESAVSTPWASAEPTARPVRTELAATDPATVDLASGRPTLVEFFAFW
jgi:hypothetical protein